MFFSLPLCSDTVSISLRLVCLVGVCACASVKFCMCVLILVAATRSYSRSTGALHTPDTFGAAGEGWVHLFLRTSPTHFSLIFSFCSLRFCCSCATHLLLCYLSACFFSFVHPPCFFFFWHCAPGCRTFQWNRMFLPVQLPVWQPFCQFYQRPFVFFI